MKNPIRTINSLLALVVAAALLNGCSSQKNVTRLETDTTIDLSGDWNDTDSRLVAEALVKDVLTRPWVADYQRVNHKNPVVIVGTVKNRTSEHIATIVFTKDMERELTNSGRVTLVASSEERSEVREERESQQENASLETMKKLQQETGADFMLRGDITSVIDQVEGEQVKFYQVNLELVNIEKNEKVWIGDKKIKKYISRSGSKF